MERLPITRNDLAWLAYCVAGIVLLFAVSITIGMVLTTLSLVWAGFVTFVLVVLVTALLAPEARAFWSKLPR